MKKKIAIWCCLAVVLGISLFFIIYLFHMLNDLIKLYQYYIPPYSMYKDIPYYNYIKVIIGFFVIIILNITIAILFLFFKDTSTKTFKEFVLEKRQLNKIKKEKQKLKKIEKLKKEIENLK